MPVKKMRLKLFLRFVMKIALLTAVTAVLGYCVRNAVISTWNEEESWIVRLQTWQPHQARPEEAAESSDDPNSSNWQVKKTDVLVTFLTGGEKGTTASLTADQLEGNRLKLESGRTYLLVRDKFEDGTVQWSIADRFRLPWVAMFVFFVCGVLVIGAGKAGVRALCGLGFSLLFLTKVFLPMILSGYSPVLAAVLAVAVSSVATVVMVVRRPRWRLVAFAGSVGGCLAAFGCGWLGIWLWQLSGMASDHGILLAGTLPGLNMESVFLASIIIGATGAVHDVAISISSALAELAEYDSLISITRLWRSGVSVGKEILGSMVDTLVLAYFGGSLFTVLLLAQAQPQWQLLFNDPMVAQEIIQSLAGTMGLVLTVPITAFAGIWSVARSRSRRHSQWR